NQRTLKPEGPSNLEEIEGGETEGSPAKVDRDVEAFSTTLLPTEGKGHSAESTTFFTTDLTLLGRHLISSPVGLGRKVIYHHA
ncbi:hypothetical protein, partial [Corynebacterium sp. HMSC069E04]|uniref:hypothetical protein n=1 Tax=Corynebacterium sp. HMSC069E04 TaxID=1739400 RepID=UPI000A8CFA03